MTEPLPFKLEIDPEKLLRYEEFKKIEDVIFVETEIEAAKTRWHADTQSHQGILRGASHGKGLPQETILPKGTLVQREQSFFEIGQDFPVKFQAVSYGMATSELLPDGSVVYFPTKIIGGKD